MIFNWASGAENIYYSLVDEIKNKNMYFRHPYPLNECMVILNLLKLGSFSKFDHFGQKGMYLKLRSCCAGRCSIPFFMYLKVYVILLISSLPFYILPSISFLFQVSSTKKLHSEVFIFQQKLY